MKDAPKADRSFPTTFFVAVSCFLLGYQATLSQVLIIREFLVVLFGNELCLGVIFFSWFVGIGLGALLGKFFIANPALIAYMKPLSSHRWGADAPPS